MEIKNTFAYFRNKANYEAAKSASGYNGDTIGSTSNTIVFVEGQGDTPGEIWTHGKQFGGGISESQITNAINNYFENQEIGDIIPDASYDNKGIVSIQRNGGINVNNGVISADLSNVVTLDGNQTITGAKTFSQNVTSTGFKVQDKNNNYVVLAGGGTKPLSEIIGTGGEGGTQYVENPYDDAWINTELSTINGNITGLRNDLNAIHNWSASEVNAAVKDAFQDWTWFKAYADANGLTGTTWSIDEYSDELGQWLRGVINVSDVGGAWSTLTQKVNSLEATVTSLSTGGATPEEIAELVSSNLGISVEDINGLKTSVAKLTTMWADSTNKEDAANWLISGYNSITNKNKTLAQLFSDAETNATNGATSAATALVQTEVNRIDGEITNVKATLGTKLDTTAVNGLITERTAGFVSQTDLNSAVSQMSAKISENDSDYYAAVKASVNKYLDENGNDITSTVAEMIAASENGLASVFVKDDDLAGRVAGILVSDGTAKANVIAAVKNGKSSLGLTADDIILSGNTTVKGKFDAIDGQFTTLNSTIATIENLDVDAINAAVATIEDLDVTNLKANRVHSYSGNGENANGFHVTIENGNVTGYNKDTTDQKYFKLKNDGSGYFAKGALNFDKNGNIYFGPTGNPDDNAMSNGFPNSSNAAFKIDGSGYVGPNAITWDGNGGGSLANGTIKWDQYGNIKFGQTVGSENFNYYVNDDSVQIGSATVENGIILVGGLYKGQNSTTGQLEDLILDKDQLNIENVRYSGMMYSVAADSNSTDPDDAVVQIRQSSVIINPTGAGNAGANEPIGFIYEVQDNDKKVLMADGTAKTISSITDGFVKANDQNTFTLTQTFNYFTANNANVNYLDIATDHHITSSDVDGSTLVITGAELLDLGTNANTATIEISSNDELVYVYSDMDITGDVVVSGTVSDSSDSTLKDIVSDTTLTVEQVANAPAVNFTWKKDADKENKKELVGTLAQYWQVVLPQVVGEGKDGKLNMQYGNAAMVSSIVTAKEVVALKERIAELERKLNELTSNQ